MKNKNEPKTTTKKSGFDAPVKGEVTKATDYVKKNGVFVKANK